FLVRRIAVFQRDLLGQDVDTRNRLDGDVAQLAIARNTSPIEEHQRASAAGSPRNADLGRDCHQQLVEVSRAGRPHVTYMKYILGLDVADDRAARSLALDDDLLLVLGLGRSLGLSLGHGA